MSRYTAQASARYIDVGAISASCGCCDLHARVERRVFVDASRNAQLRGDNNERAAKLLELGAHALVRAIALE